MKWHPSQGVIISIEDWKKAGLKPPPGDWEYIRLIEEKYRVK